MILTCPECATSYFVDDAKISSHGRSVRCASCGARWTAKAESVLELTATPEEGAVAVEPASFAPPEADAPISALPAEELPKVFRARAEVKRNVKEATAAGIVWAVIGVAFLGVIGASIIFRADVVRIWPKAASAYAHVGLPVNSTGLSFEDIGVQPALQDGHAALVVSGKIRNVEERAVAAPPLRIDLLDKHGKQVAVKIADPENAHIPPGEIRHFVVSLLDPPVSAQDVEVAFVLPERAAKPHGKADAKLVLRGPAEPSAHPAPAPALRPAEPGHPIPDAAPLAADDPHALPHE